MKEDMVTTAAQIKTAGRAAMLGAGVLAALWRIETVSLKLRSVLARVVSTCVFAFIGMSSAAADLERCDVDGGEMTISDARDLGNGYIASYVHSWWIGGCVVDSKTGKEVCDGSGTWDTLIVESCASGEFIASPIYSCSDTSGKCDQKSFLDVRAKSSAILDEAAPSQTISFKDLAAMLKAFSAKTAINQPEQPVAESCLCHVAYPTLRGKKERYEVSSVYIDGKLQ